jgi:hypothetical protein
MIDLSPMSAVRVDAVRRKAGVGGGSLLETSDQRPCRFRADEDSATQDPACAPFQGSHPINRVVVGCQADAASSTDPPLAPPSAAPAFRD